MDNSQFDRLLHWLSDGAASTLATYTHYMVVSSIVWIVVAICLLISALLAFKAAHKYPGDGDPLLVLSGVLVVIGTLMLAANVVDLLAPQAAAIHQLIKDIRGGK